MKIQSNSLNFISSKNMRNVLQETWATNSKVIWNITLSSQTQTPCHFEHTETLHDQILHLIITCSLFHMGFQQKSKTKEIYWEKKGQESKHSIKKIWRINSNQPINCNHTHSLQLWWLALRGEHTERQAELQASRSHWNALWHSKMGFQASP